MIDDCEQEVIATSMDRNISGQPGLNQDQSNPEDNSRDKNGHEVPDAKETEQGNRKTGEAPAKGASPVFYFPGTFIPSGCRRR